MDLITDRFPAISNLKEHHVANRTRLASYFVEHDRHWPAPFSVIILIALAIFVAWIGFSVLTNTTVGRW